MAAHHPRKKFGASQKERIFFACLPDEETAARIHALADVLKQDRDLTGTLILPEHLHVTLFHLGDWAALPDEIVRIAMGAAAEAVAAPFEVEFERVESFRNRTGIYPLVLSGDAAQWRRLHAALGAALKRAGLAAATQGDFQPHVTLAYDPVRLKPAAIEAVSWTVRDFVLVHSRLGKTTHSHLGRWPLKS